MSDVKSESVARGNQESATATVAAVPPLKAASYRAPGLVDVGVESDLATQEQVVFALAAAKRHDGVSFLGDFATTLLEYAPEAQGQLFQDVFAAFIARFRRDGYFIEVGTGDGKLISNTYFLEKRFGWGGLVVEPNPAFLPALKQNRTCQISTDCVYDVSGRPVKFMCTAEPEFSRVRDDNTDLHDAKRVEDYTEIDLVTVSLNDLCDLNDCPAIVDYLSIDVEGPEFDILQTFDFRRRRINCISVEHNWSSNRGAIFDLLTDNGFVRVFEHLSQWDDWYVQRDLLAEFPAAQHLLPPCENAKPKPEEADRFLRWALEAVVRGEPQVAETLCLRAIEIDGKIPAAHRTLAEIATIQGRRKLALERWRAAVASEPNDYWARIGLAEMLASRGDIGAAVSHLTEAVSLGDDTSRARDMLEKLTPKLSGR